MRLAECRAYMSCLSFLCVSEQYPCPKMPPKEVGKGLDRADDSFPACAYASHY